MHIDQTTIVESVVPEKARVSPRFTLLYLLLIAALALLLSRSFYLQIVKGSEFRSTAESNRIAAVPVAAPRGIIYDVTGEQLVENVASTDIVLDPSEMTEEESVSLLMEKLPELVSISPQELKAAIDQTRQTQQQVRLVSAIDHDLVLALERALPELPGVRLSSTLVRSYPKGRLTAHVLGYTGAVSSAELAKRPELLITDIIGKIGLEQAYDKELRGQYGVSYQEVNAEGKSLQSIRRKDPIAGQELHLTLNVALQEYIYTKLEERAEAELDKPPLAAAVVVMDPRSGAVRALVSYPTYDSNLFSRPNQAEAASKLFKDEREPLFNRVISGTYVPGSTIKPLLAAGALQEGIIDPSSTILSTGGLNVGEWSFPDWRSGGHGVTNVTKAIAESVNTFFYSITGGYESQKGLGPEAATTYLKEFGWSSKTGIDLPGEATGFLPSPEWKLAAKGERWYLGDTYHLGIGQGDVLVTPLQVATATAGIANQGMLPQPFIVRSLRWPDGEMSSLEVAARQLKFSSQHLRTVAAGMRQAVTDGSGRALANLSIPLAGKTGTAQIGGTDDTHAWFTSFGPYDEPELVVTVLLERGGAGDKDAVPLARDIWQWWIDHSSN